MNDIVLAMGRNKIQHRQQDVSERAYAALISTAHADVEEDEQA